LKGVRFAIAANLSIDFRRTDRFGTMEAIGRIPNVLTRKRSIMFGIGRWEMLIVGGICLLFMVGLVVVVVVVATMSNKKSNDE